MCVGGGGSHGQELSSSQPPTAHSPLTSGPPSASRISRVDPSTKVRDCGASSIRGLTAQILHPHCGSGAWDSSVQSSRRSHIDWHCLAAPAPGAGASGASGTSSAESSGARGGHRGRRARGLPSARMSAGGQRLALSVWRRGGAGEARTPHSPALSPRAGPRARAARPCVPPLPPPLPGKPARLGLAGGSARGRPRPSPPPSAAAERAGSSQGLGGGGVWPQLLLLLHLLAPSICRGYGPSLEHKRVSAAGVGVALAFPHWGVR